MRIPSNKIKDIVRFFKEELQDLYEEREVKSFVNLVMQEFTGLDYAQLLMSDDKTVSESVMLKIKFAINDLKVYKPVQYILGKTIFYDLEFIVNPSVLIPRPETEELVQWIISDYKNNFNFVDIIDIGTGSGCIPIALKSNLELSKVYGIDISKDALKVAELNALNNQVDIHYKQIDIFDTEKWSKLPLFDVIVSNPPYICESEKELMQANVINYEPHLALFVENDNPLIYYNIIADFAKDKLKPEGSLYFEINEGLAYQTIDLLEAKGFSHSEIKKDMQGKNRFIKSVY
jgi:release factor glutamine methyltransferase